MLLIIRLATALALFVFLFIVSYFAICIVGGAVSGAFAGAASQNSQDAYEAGRQAGGNFVRHNLLLIVGGSFLFSAVSSVVLSFSGLLPWCRKPKEPPRM